MDLDWKSQRLSSAVRLLALESHCCGVWSYSAGGARGQSIQGHTAARIHRETQNFDGAPARLTAARPPIHGGRTQSVWTRQ